MTAPNSPVTLPLQANVLIVEDHVQTRHVVRTVLKHIGVRNITEAQDGLAALKLLQERNLPRHGTDAAPSNPFDIVICDWVMPEMTGVELLREVRKNVFLSKVPFCMLTGENERSAIMEAIDHGAEDYILKPFSTKTLEEKLRKILASVTPKPR
ncbi:MAG: response regulator [Oligoflexia bacterium]|nr:response regulator [Oligoflexia bacterium]